MCTLATIKLQVRIFCWLKLTLSIYIFAIGIYFASSTVIKQAFGLAYVGYGVGLVFLGLLSGVMVFPQKFGVDRHNRFLLGLSFVCDTIVFAEMINFTGIVNSYIAPEFPKALQLDCLSIAPQTYSASQCSEYFNSDRVAGMRLVWESYFSDKSNKLSYQMLQNLERGCCGFFTPFNCIPNKNSFPEDRYVGNIKSQLLEQRVICSNFANYYPAQDNCIDYYDYSANPPIIGGCKYDMGVGYCLTVDIDGSMIGCASAVEDYSVTLISPHVPLLMICAAVHALFMLYSCCMWWKRKDSDVFPEFTTVTEEKVKYENVKDQFEVVPRRGSLLKDGFLPVATYKQLVEEKAAVEEEESEEHADDRGGPHGVVPIYEKTEDV